MILIFKICKAKECGFKLNTDYHAPIKCPNKNPFGNPTYLLVINPTNDVSPNPGGK